MNKRFKVICVLIASMLAAALTADELLAQSRSENLRIRRIQQELVKAPVYSSNYTGGSSSPKWFQVTVEYETAPEWIDQLEFRYWVLVRGAAANNPFTMFTADVTYLDIARGKHVSTMFMKPNTLARYGEVEGVAVEISYQGNLVAQEAEPKPKRGARWWRESPVAPKTSYLLNRGETPFAFIDVNSYETIAPKARF
ncbi:MAG: hypothetical protein JXR37_33405 [Kiritimatiellae bacterium]|nr:hypothetical protein [Kiritimatiellia bacterium]